MKICNKETNKRKIIGVTGIWSLFAVWGLPYLLNLKGNTLAVSNSWFAVFAWGVCWFLSYRACQDIGGVQDAPICERQKAEEQEPGQTVGVLGAVRNKCQSLAAAGILGSLFSVCMAFGAQLDRAESVNFLDGGMWRAVLVWAVMLTVWIYRSWMWLEQWQERRKSGNRSEHGKGWKAGNKKLNEMMMRWDGLSGKKQAMFTVLFLLLCWLPVFLAVYPGFFVYDAQDELIQVQTRNFTTHHPLPHVLLLGGIILAVNKVVGSYNAGIAVYTLFQMVLMAGVFTYVISYMKKVGIRRWLRGLSLLYFGLFPVNVMFVLCSAKDGIFSGAFLLLLTMLVDMVKRREDFFKDWKKQLLFVGSALVMMSFRHNGMYAFLVMVPILLLYIKGYRRKAGLLVGAAFAAYFVLTSGLTAVLHAEDSENQEMLTVPIQQLARTWKYDGDSMTEEQKEALYEILPEEVLSYYTPKVSDGVKIAFNNEAFSVNPSRYMKLWAEVGLAHPFTYVNAWLMTSYGFWYPDTVIDVYRGNSVFTFTYEDSSFFGYEVEQPGVRESKLPWLDECYRQMSLEIAQQKVPVVSMLFSPGFLFWVFAFAAGYAFYRKKYELLIPFGLILLLWLTVILGPTYLPRYVLVLWFALPGAVAVLVN